MCVCVRVCVSPRNVRFPPKSPLLSKVLHIVTDEVVMEIKIKNDFLAISVFWKIWGSKVVLPCAPQNL